MNPVESGQTGQADQLILCKPTKHDHCALLPVYRLIPNVNRPFYYRCDIFMFLFAEAHQLGYVIHAPSLMNMPQTSVMHAVPSDLLRSKLQLFLKGW